MIRLATPVSHLFENQEYEKIIEDPEKQIRILIEKCDLKWNNNCLKFYQNKRPIKKATDNIKEVPKLPMSTFNLFSNRLEILSNQSD